ncbi:unnamed protein product [Rotaria sordida]|uniref:Uncharacterized protein n=1 Tax=Rotaria sordida TaxID=392033 RepID=A0A819WVY8_9BILA|nr:unnamed protein product [Rotaria sordida]CAF1424302.1 unnamed protein product [Rotaria sordida]CAF3988689.1 unnamed protein product [Rotaria sordida]CAF4130365.1 unnamed protein product [Rotaria sordida]
MRQSFDRLQIGTSSITIDSVSSSTSSYQVTSNNTVREQISSLDRYYSICKMPSLSNSATTFIKQQLCFKEELQHYISTAHTGRSFSHY